MCTSTHKESGSCASAYRRSAVDQAGSEVEFWQGRGGSVRVFDPVEPDDDALQRDLEGGVIPGVPLAHEDEDMLDSTPSGEPRVFGPEPDPIAFRRPRRSVSVHGSQVPAAEAEFVATSDVEPEEGSVISTSGEGVVALFTHV